MEIWIEYTDKSKYIASICGVTICCPEMSRAFFADDSLFRLQLDDGNPDTHHRAKASAHLRNGRRIDHCPFCGTEIRQLVAKHRREKKS